MMLSLPVVDVERKAAGAVSYRRYANRSCFRDFLHSLDKRTVIAKIIVFKNIAAQRNGSISSFLAAFKILWGVVI